MPVGTLEPEPEFTWERYAAMHRQAVQAIATTVAAAAPTTQLAWAFRRALAFGGRR